MKKLDLYILTELAGPFFFGVAAFSSIMIGSSLLFQMAKYLIELDMPLELAGKIFLLELPAVIVLTFPMSTLLATLLAFGRLSGNSEIIAMKASGVSFLRLIIPVLIVGLLVSFFTIYINEGVVPYAKFENRRLYYEFTHNSKLPTTQNHLIYNPIDKKTGFPDYILYARVFDGEERALSDVFYLNFENKQLNALVEAKEAKWLDNQWVFLEGESLYLPADDEPVIRAEFNEYIMKDLTQSPQQLTLSQKSRNEEELTAIELRELITNLRALGRDVKKILVTYYQRYAVPFSCLIFALIGAALGLQPNRGGSSIGLGISIIVIFVYYIMLTVGGAIGQIGLIPPFFGAWLPNILFGLVGLFLNIKAAR